jgi:glycosyltransferase involved in cell wall biosynthesis
MKILLLTDIPPCRNFTAGLVLAQLCRFLPRGSLVCFTILNRHLRPDYCPDLYWIPIEVVAKPDEFGLHHPLPEPLGMATALAVENYRRLMLIPRLVARAANFARAHNVDLIWAVLQGQTMIRVASALADRLALPMVSQVWDPLSWWLQAHRVDPWNRLLAKRQFDRAVRQSASCITASRAMAEHFQKKYGVHSVPVIASHHLDVLAPPSPRLRNSRGFVVGMAGQFYALEGWMNLLSAMDYAGWQIAGRCVRLLLIGQKPPPFPLPKQAAFVSGKSPAETIRMLADGADVLYCPYPFASTLDEVARLSFPSKLPLYLAAGRPVLFHGPADSAPARFLAETGAGVICREGTPAAIYNELERLAISPALYEQTVCRGRTAFLQNFTLDHMRAQFADGLGVPMTVLSAPISPLTDAAPTVPSGEAETEYIIVRRPWKVRARQRLKKVLALIPPVRRYLTQKYILQDSWDRAAAERDALAVECGRLRSEVEGERTALAEISQERDNLRAKLKAVHAAVQTVTAERDRFLINVRDLQTEVATLTDDKAQYQDVTLGKLTIVQSQIRTLQDNLFRLSQASAGAISGELSRNLYLDLLEDSLIGTTIKDDSIAPWGQEYDASVRELGRDWPRLSLTMIGKARMRNLRQMVETVLSDGTAGDFLEAGAWRGGACIYMRGILKAHGIIDRIVWAADSFAGLPPPDPRRFPADRGDVHHTFATLAVSLDEVRDNFSRYGLLDERVKFLPGWFKETLPQAPIKQLALLRLDGDMYESTIQTMDALYAKVSPGGIVIVDDYVLRPCRQAIDDYRAQHAITAKLEAIDGAAVYWRKPAHNREE